MLRSESSGDVVAVQTSKNTLYSKKAIIVAAGCWSGSVLHDLIKHSEIELDFPVKPRKVRILCVNCNASKFELFQFHGCYLCGIYEVQKDMDVRKMKGYNDFAGIFYFYFYFLGKNVLFHNLSHRKTIYMYGNYPNSKF